MPMLAMAQAGIQAMSFFTVSRRQPMQQVKDIGDGEWDFFTTIIWRRMSAGMD